MDNRTESSASAPAALRPRMMDAAPAAAHARARRVLMVGLRGVPNVQGGVEKHVEMLGSELVRLGWQVEVIGRSHYLSHPSAREWNGLRITPLWAPRTTTLEAFVHTLLVICLAGWRRPDIVHIHAIGPALMAPLARLLGLKVAVTHHGYDYDRQKWGQFAKTMLRLGERLGMRFSQARIAVSDEIARTMTARYGVATRFVPNGVAVESGAPPTGILDEFALTPRRYVLLAARLVPEKRQTDLIRAFAMLDEPGWQLVLAGGAEFESPYAREVRELAAGVPGVVLTGFQTGDRLAELFSNAALFVLPSSHEGMPITLLEAMAHGLQVLASDIVAHRELDLARQDYFPLGDTEALAAAIAAKLAAPPTSEQTLARIAHVATAYSWTGVARQTAQIYDELLAG